MTLFPISIHEIEIVRLELDVNNYIRIYISTDGILYFKIVENGEEFYIYASVTITTNIFHSLGIFWDNDSNIFTIFFDGELLIDTGLFLPYVPRYAGIRLTAQDGGIANIWLNDTADGLVTYSTYDEGGLLLDLTDYTAIKLINTDGSFGYLWPSNDLDSIVGGDSPPDSDYYSGISKLFLKNANTNYIGKVCLNDSLDGSLAISLGEQTSYSAKKSSLSLKIGNENHPLLGKRGNFILYPKALDRLSYQRFYMNNRS
jgi:hypothetical protein